MAHTLNDYISLLEREGLLAAPVPADLDREQPIALVSCDSRTVVPGTLFVCKGGGLRKREALAGLPPALHPPCRPAPGHGPHGRFVL